MKIDEAITIFHGLECNPLFSERHFKAFDMAIASLEAWERVKDDIHEYETDCMVSADCQDCKDCNVVMFKSIYHIIDKHLQEVKE